MIKFLLKLLYSGKVKEIKKDEKSFESDLQKLSKIQKRLEKNKEKANEDLHDPEVQDAFKQVGIDVTKWPNYIKDERDERRTK